MIKYRNGVITGRTDFEYIEDIVKCVEKCLENLFGLPYNKYILTLSKFVSSLRWQASLPCFIFQVTVQTVHTDGTNTEELNK